MVSYKEVQRFLGESWNDFQRCFTENLRSDIPLLDKANRFIIEHGGKKLRPTFALLIAQALRGMCNEFVIKCAAASEILHTATLIHDDVADNAPTRRGVPTMSALYSPSTAVLLGDFWLSRAMDLIIDHPDRRVLHIYSKCLCDLAEGEMLQLEKAEKSDTDEEAYRSIIYRKTTSLFEAGILSAAYSVEASEDELACCKDYAFHIGQSFQMMDDILDYSPELSTGKPAGQDILEKKITLPLLGLFAKAPAKLVKDVRKRIKNPDSSLVQEIMEMVREYGGMEYARQRLAAEIQAAKLALRPLEDTQAKNCLEDLAELMAVRTA